MGKMVTWWHSFFKMSDYKLFLFLLLLLASAQGIVSGCPASLKCLSSSGACLHVCARTLLVCFVNFFKTNLDLENMRVNAKPSRDDKSSGTSVSAGCVPWASCVMPPDSLLMLSGCSKLRNHSFFTCLRFSTFTEILICQIPFQNPVPSVIYLLHNCS